jgi:hypothetical protein
MFGLFRAFLLKKAAVSPLFLQTFYGRKTHNTVSRFKSLPKPKIKKDFFIFCLPAFLSKGHLYQTCLTTYQSLMFLPS